MAETDDDNNIDVGGYRLLWDEFKFVTNLAKGSEKIAEEVLRTFLQGGATNPKWFSDPARGFGTKENVRMPIPSLDYSHERYRIWQVEGWSGGRVPSPFKSEFWYSYPERNIYSHIDYRHSSARWTGPVQYDVRTVSKEDIALEWEVMGKLERADYRASLIRLHHETLLAMLRVIGLLPPLAELAPESMTPGPEQATSFDMPIAPAAVDGIPPAAESEPFRPPLTRSQQRIEAVLKHVYPNGLPPKREARDSILIHAVQRNWNDTPNPEKLSVPSYSAISRFVKTRRS